MAGLSLRHISKVYANDVHAVNDVSLEVADGEFLVIVGPSGCGKSTMLRMMAGLDDITSGELYIGDRLVNDVEPKDRDVAMVFQNYALYPYMTVYKNMAFGLKQRHMPRKEIDRRVREAAEILDLTDLLDRKPQALSGGQRQRVAMGRAIVRDPKVFLMDEPLSNLDAKLRGQMRLEIANLHKRLGTTFIYVTHDQTEAMTLGTRIAVMDSGTLQQVDTPTALYDTPANKYVAGFIGTPQMGFVDCTCCEDAGGLAVELAEIKATLPHAKAAGVKQAGLVDAPLTLGIRSEDIYLGGRDVPAEACPLEVSATVSACELLGADALLYFKLGEAPLVARVPMREAVAAGSEARFVLDLNKAHLFERASGAAVAASA